MRLVRLLLLCGICALSAWGQQAHAAAPPSILWLIAEDFGPELGCYGTAQVSTPNLDKLASQGVRYTRAYSTAPVCSASRSAFMTGNYQTNLGAHNHRSHRDDGYRLPTGARLITYRMHDLGYFTANLRNLPAPCGFSGTGKTDWNFGDPTPPFDSENWSDLAAHQPFFAQINFAETHRPFKAEKKADPDKVVLPPYYPDHPVARQDWAAYLDAASELDRKVGKVLAQLDADGLSGNTIVIFTSDHGQAHVRGKQFCYEEGLHVPLIIRWARRYPTPKHFQAGTVDNRLIESIDLVPTFLAIAKTPKPGGMQGQVFLGDFADAPRDYTHAARDRCDETVFRIRTASDGRYRYIRNFTPDRPFLQPNKYKEDNYPVWNLLKELDAEGKLTPAQKALTAPKMPKEELYDLTKDPHEIQSLAGSDDPATQAVLARLRTEVEHWVVDSDDLGRIPEQPGIIATQGVTRAGGKPNAGFGPRSFTYPSGASR